MGTRDAREALRVARPLAVAALDLFARLEAALKAPTPAEILANAERLRELKSSGSATLPGGGTLSFSIEEEDTANPTKLAAFLALDKAKREELQAAVARSGPSVPEAMLEYQRKQGEEMARFKAELAAEAEARAMATPDTEVEEDLPAFKPSRENLLSLRWEEYVLKTKANGWSGKRTTPENEKKAREFMEWWGEDRDIRFITRKTINRFIVHLQSERVLAAGPKKGQTGMNNRTVDNYTSVLNAFLEWAQGKGYFPDSRKLPTEGQALVSRAERTRRKDKANPAYTKGQLKKLFAPEVYQFRLAHHFWPPLIALFTGARRREVAQLLLSDIQIVDGIPAISINIDEDPDKSVKTEAAKRLIPIHPELLAIGFLQYAADVEKLGLGGELFPGIGVNQHDEKGNAIGNAWRRHRESLGVAGARAPTFHSFRSTALRVLKDRGVHLEMRCQLVGHDLDHAGQNYDMTPFSVKTLFEEGIPNLVYEGLDLSGIRYVPNQFDKTNQEGAVKVAKSEKRIGAREAAKAAEEAVRKADRRAQTRRVHGKE